MSNEISTPTTVGDREFFKFCETIAGQIAVRIAGDVALASGAETTVIESGAQRVNDSINGLLLKEILEELKLMNTHLQIITDEDITHAN